MLRLLLAFITCCTFTLQSKSQNLVPNPSFEVYDTCPTSFDQINYAFGWYGFSSEYYNSCAPDGSFSFGVPSNFLGHQDASTGNAYGGLYTYGNNNYREHIGTPLHTPLIAGTRYFISFKVSLANTSNCATNIGIILSNTPYSVNQPLPILNYCTIHYSGVIYDKFNWTVIDGSFIADSSYEYLTIGNFFSDSITDNVSTTFGCGAYYFVDDVCISSNSQDCHVVASTENLTAKTISLYPNPASNILNVPVFSDYTEITIYDVVGNIKYQTTGDKAKQGVDISEFSNGLYCIKLKDELHIRSAKLLVKN